MGILSDLLGGFASDLYKEIPSDITDLYTTPLEQIEAPDMTFKPFTVTSSVGGVTGGPEGTDITLSPEQLAMQQQLFGAAGDLYSQAAGPIARRESDIYQRIRAAQSPEEERLEACLGRAPSATRTPRCTH